MKTGPDLSVQGSAGTDRGDQSGNGGTDSVWKRKPHDHRLCAFRRKRAEISAGPDEGHPRGTKDAATVETKLIALAAWMRHTYGSTMIQALKTVLPVKVKARGKETREIALLADPARCEELLENYRKKIIKRESVS